MPKQNVKSPPGTLGIVLSSSNENRQEDLFHPTDNRMIAVNVNGDWEYGTVVYDLNEKSEIDPERGARLQSAFRVVKEPHGTNNAIAFQLGPSGQSDSGGGYFFGLLDGGREFGVAQGGHDSGGPFHIGHPQDKHKRGVDADGNPINSLHIGTLTNFYRDKTFDGPLRFESEYKEGDDHPFAVPVHLGWTGGDWAWWTSMPIYTPTGRTRPLQFREDKRPTKVVWNPEIPGPVPTPTVRLRRRPGEPPEGDRPPVETPGNVPRNSLSSGMYFVGAAAALAAPAFISRPQNYRTTEKDTGAFGGTPTGDARKKLNNAPLSVVESGFAAQGGSVVVGGGSGDATFTGAQGDPWAYTQRPAGSVVSGTKASHYEGGTASGGTVFHPPETDLRDVADYGMQPPGVTLSKAYKLAGPNAYWGAGVPELVDGTIKDGYSWGFDTATGDLVFYSHTGSAGQDEAVRFTNGTQEIQWRAGTDYRGTLSHAITADRTWTFPNATGGVNITTFTQTDTQSVSNTTTETTFFSTGVGSLTLPANFFTSGRTLRVRIRGLYSTQAVPVTLRVRLKLGSTTILDTGANTTSGSASFWRMELNSHVTCQVEGSGGTVWGLGEVNFDAGAGSNKSDVWPMNNTSATALDTTASHVLNVTVEWGAGVSASDAVHSVIATVEALN